MTDYMSLFFGPISKRGCMYFFLTTVIFFVMLVLIFFSELIFAYQNYGRLNFRIISNGLLILFNIFLTYFVNRLLYNMCTNSLA